MQFGRKCVGGREGRTEKQNAELCALYQWFGGQGNLDGFAARLVGCPDRRESAPIVPGEGSNARVRTDSRVGRGHCLLKL